MTHAQFRDLLVTSVDFPLPGLARTELDRHLGQCDACRAWAVEIEADAEALRAIAFAHPPARVRANVLGAADRATPPQWSALRLVLAAALLLLAALAATLGTGALLDGREPLGSMSWRPAPGQPALEDATGSLRVAGIAARAAPGGATLVAAVSASSGPRLLVSPDGLTWTGAIVDGLDEASIADVAFLQEVRRGDQFVAIGAAAGRPATWWSTDGISWEFEPVDDASGVVRAIAAHDGVAVALGSGAGNPTAWTRGADGSWEAQPLRRDVIVDEVAPLALVHDGRRFLAVATETTWTSRAGDVWTDAPNDLPPATSLAVVGRDGRLVAVGVAGDSPAGWTSSDGTRWAPARPSGGTGRRVAVAYGGGRYLAVGSAGSGAAVWHSTDGAAWTAESAPPGGTGAVLLDVAWLEGSAVAVGAVGTSGAVWVGEGHEGE